MAIKFTEEQIQEIERLALLNCNSNTIAENTGIPVTTLKRRFGRKLRKYWAMHRANLRQAQDNLKETSADMAKFLGVNNLNQVAKQVIATEEPEEKAQTELERKASKAAAAAYNRVISREGGIIKIKGA